MQLKRTGILLGLFLLLSGASCLKAPTLTPTSTPTTTATTAAEATSSPSPTTAAAEDLTNIDPTSFTVEGSLLAGQTAAQKWHSDAILYAVVYRLPNTLAAGQSTQTFVFGSTADAANWFTYSITEDTGKFIRAVIPKEDYLGRDLTPMARKFWKTNYVAAFQIAEQSGGANFRATSTVAEITLTLQHSQPNGWLWYVVEYRPADGSASLRVRINPSDQTVVDENGKVLNTPSSS